MKKICSHLHRERIFVTVYRKYMHKEYVGTPLPSQQYWEHLS